MYYTATLSIIYIISILSIITARKDSNAGKKSLKRRQEKTQRQARKDSKEGKKRLQDRQQKTSRQARND